MLTVEFRFRPTNLLHVTPTRAPLNLYNLTYLLTPWSRIPLQKLTGSAASQEIPLIFGTRRFLTVNTSARHLSLSWANSIQSPPPPPTSRRSILILSSHLRLGLPSDTVNTNSRIPDCQCSLFLKKNPIIRTFCIPGWLAVPINPDKWSSTVFIIAP